MKTIFYLAMTARERSLCPVLPEGIAHMACHFSPYEAGLEGIPNDLPSGSMIILNDRIPFRDHDCGMIAWQLASIPCDSLLLDLRRTDPDTVNKLVNKILSAVSFPIALPERYAAGWDCPVFLDSVDADTDPFSRAEAWKGRELWLDLSPGFIAYRINNQGAERIPGGFPGKETVHKCDVLHCRYQIALTNDCAAFTLWRDCEDALEILRQGKEHGITRGVGLWQEWNRFRNFP